jgi:hypothetical protein
MVKHILAIYAILLAVAPIQETPIDPPKDIDRWYAIKLPEADSEQWQIAEDDIHNEWAVNLVGGKVQAKQHEAILIPKPLPFEVKSNLPLPFGMNALDIKSGKMGKHTDYKVNDGWIISFNRGEFGGELWWFSLEGSNRYKISDSNILFVVKHKNDYYAIDGLAHGLFTNMPFG